MSVNQSKGDKNEPSQYRRLVRSGNSAVQRNFSGGVGKGGDGGGGGTASSFSSNRSYKKVGNNAQGVQPRVSSPNSNVNSDSSSSNVQNGTHLQPPVIGPANTPVAGATRKSTDGSTPKGTPTFPKAQQGNTATPGLDYTSPATPVKGQADSSKSFPLQFGTISPGFVNGMQIPARTNSAPPNFDEQKQAQIRIDSLKATKFPTPAIPKQQPPRKDAAAVDQSHASEAHSSLKPRKDVQVSASPAAPLPQAQKVSGHPVPVVSSSMSMPFHHSQLHVQFSGPNPQMQSQPMPLRMPLPPMGNPPQMPQQVFVTGIQHHPMQSQGLIHHSQGLSFSSQLGPPPQLTPQLGNMGIGPGPQYQQQQMSKLSANRKTVKITHPDTHEELLLDKRTDGYADGGSSGPRARPQSQAILSFPPAHPLKYYSNSYNASPPFFQSPNSNLLTSSQITPGSQAPRFNNQVTIKPISSASPAPVNDSMSLGAEVAKRATVNKPENKVGGESMSIISGSSPSPENDVSLDSGVPEKPKPQTPPLGTEGSLSETSKKEESPTNVPGNSASESGSGEDGLKSIEKGGIKTNSDSCLKVEGPSAEPVASEERDTVTTTNNETGSLDTARSTIDNSDGKLLSSVSTAEVDDLNAKIFSLNLGSSNGDKNDSVVLDKEPPMVSVSVSEEPPSAESEDATSNSSGLTSPSASSSVDKTLPETSKAKGNIAKPKKKRKDILKHADAQGITFDLYMAYKGPEEKKETVESSSGSGISPKPAIADSSEKNVSSDEKHDSSKFEPDDWEDAADVSTPKDDTLDYGKRSYVDLRRSEDGDDGMKKKYSRDFLLKFSNLPECFEITSDIAEAVIASNVNVYGKSNPSPGRGTDKSVGGPRLDRRLSNLGDDDKWSKHSGHMGSGRDMRIDVGYVGNVAGFRSGQGGNYGVSRNTRAQTHVQYADGILTGPMQSPGAHAVLYRNNSDSDKWQRATGSQRGLIPSPQTPLQVMHKAERKYQVGKITDEEQAKQRQLKGILNKLTPQNFEKLFEQVKQVNIDNTGTLSGVIDQIFDKALMEPTFCEMYANFCSRLSVELPDFSENNKKITFKRLLLNKCQEEFERGKREEEEANRTEEEGELKQSDEEREEKRVKARRRMLGNIRLIGELYKKRMLTESIMHDCIKKLLGQYRNPDEEDIEALCKLMSTIGEMIDHLKAKDHMVFYFDTMSRLSNNMKLSSRLRFMLKDVIDLRKNKWQQRRKVEGPKKIEEVHRDAAQERQAQSSRLARGPSFNSSTRRGQPVDFGLRGPNPNLIPSPNAHMSGFRGLPQQLRGYGNQDNRFESFENRTLSIPSRPNNDDSITLGPQGGLARGMSQRGQSLMPSMPVPEMASPADPRRVAGGPNAYGSIHGLRDDFTSRYIPERLSAQHVYDLSNMHEHSVNYVNRDMRNAERGTDRVQPSSPSAQAWVPTPHQNTSSERVWPEERFRDMSMEAIKEFYSVRDEKEVVLCIKDLNSPSFHPTMISIWVTDSFERKDVNRELLANLLINLTKSQDGILSQGSLVKGMESVLATLEDAVNDAPKAAEFLGCIFARLLMENAVPYTEAWRLILEGGEEQGSLVESGLAAEVLGVILEIIKSEKGDSFLNLIRTGTNLQVENFRPPNSERPLRLDKFVFV